MASIDYPEPVRILIGQLKRLPGVGPKSAERIAVWLLQQGRESALPVSESVANAATEVGECGVCGFFATLAAGCAVCDSPQREPNLLCIVEQPTDILPLERSGAYRGHYHSLRGRISPLDDIGPDDLDIAGLLRRVRDGAVGEVILALNATVEGQTTAHYVADRLAGLGCRVTRLAHGVPVGGELDYLDDGTLIAALKSRRSL